MKPLYPLFLAAALWALPFPSRAGEFPEKGPQPLQAEENQGTFNRCWTSAQHGDPKAMGALGLLYETGLGCEKDAAKAVLWLRKGAVKGDAEAQNNLGFLYVHGLGVAQDYGQALRWFQKAADQGLASAQANLGLLYGRGWGVPRDDARSFGWFRRAALQGDPDAEVNLAQMYSLGEGTAQDDVESYKWFAIALRGETDAVLEAQLRDDLQWLEKRMSGDEVGKAGKLAADWKPLMETGSAVGKN